MIICSYLHDVIKYNKSTLIYVYKIYKTHNREDSLFVCLLGFNVAFKHLRSYLDGACL